MDVHKLTVCKKTTPYRINSSLEVSPPMIQKEKVFENFVRPFRGQNVPLSKIHGAENVLLLQMSNSKNLHVSHQGPPGLDLRACCKNDQPNEKENGKSPFKQSFSSYFLLTRLW